jgi:diguanylate cyclase (GGDEF)-like protein
VPDHPDRVLQSQVVELSASQAAKLFHLSPGDIDLLAHVRRVLLDSSETILNRLFGRLSMLPEGTRLFLGRRHPAQASRMRRWLQRCLRPWDPEIREPRLKPLALHCARTGVPMTYVTAVFACLEEVCLEVLAEGNHTPPLPPRSSEILRRRLATEQTGFLSICSREAHRIAAEGTRRLEQTVRERSERLRSTIRLSQAVTSEVDETQVMRVLAHHVLEVFHPDFLVIHTILQGDFVESPVCIINGEVSEVEDDDAMHRLRKDWSLCRAARTGEVVHVSDVERSLLGCPFRAWPSELGSYCCVPLASGTQVLGWMHLRRQQAGGFCEEELEVLGIYGQMVGTAITSHRLVVENRRQATTDSLTGLSNRRHFESVMQKEELLLARRGSAASLLMLDIDHFKGFNDNFGHETGNRILVAFGVALRNCLRRSDEVARIGGDEFVVLLRDCDSEHAARVAAKVLLVASETSVRIDATTCQHLEISAGVAACPQHAGSLEETLLLADVALLRAKESGKNRYITYDDSVDGAVLSARGRGRGLSR